MASKIKYYAPISKQYPMKRGELYTPITKELLGWLEELRVKHGSWAQLCRVCRINNRHLRHVRTGWFLVIGMGFVDKILTRGESAHRVNELEWLTVEECVFRGYWEPMSDWRPPISRSRRLPE